MLSLALQQRIASGVKKKYIHNSLTHPFLKQKHNFSGGTARRPCRKSRWRKMTSRYPWTRGASAWTRTTTSWSWTGRRQESSSTTRSAGSSGCCCPRKTGWSSRGRAVCRVTTRSPSPTRLAGLRRIRFSEFAWPRKMFFGPSCCQSRCLYRFDRLFTLFPVISGWRRLLLQSCSF